MGFLRRSMAAYAVLNAAHILSIGLLWGAVATLDLRLLGAFRAHPLAHLGPPLRRIAMAGLGAAVLTGALLFSVRPVAYAENPAFLAKLALVALGAGNALLVGRGAAWRRALAGGAVPVTLRASAAGSLLLWAAAVLAGRWIGFLQ